MYIRYRRVAKQLGDTRKNCYMTVDLENIEINIHKAYDLLNVLEDAVAYKSEEDNIKSGYLYQIQLIKTCLNEIIDEF